MLLDLQAGIPARYRVEKEIGRGGMATVYVADDTQLARRVAIKVLSPELGSSLSTERFAREIRVLAQLNHPNILPVLDSGAANGLLYYVMPFVEGESLAARLERERQLPIEDAVSITCEVADALSFAHAAGIIHRDVKPENVLLSGGHAVVADFGIARLLNDDGGGKLTMTGMSLGTAAYMSPEQASGEGADGRSDLYSLACVLYELLVGTPPFTGPNAMAVMARHAMEPPPSIRIVRAAVPADLEAAVMHALEKSPVDRFRSVAEFKAALLGEATTAYTARYTARHTAQFPGGEAGRPGAMSRRMSLAIAAAVMITGSALGYVYLKTDRGIAQLQAEQAGAPAGPPPSSIAVLYFDDQSPDRSLQHVADGLTESLVLQLSDVAALDVVSANGVRQFRGRDLPPDSVSRSLGVGTLVRGSVAPAPGGVRVDVDLVDAVSGASFGRKSMVFPAARLQVARDSIAQEVALLLRAQLGNEVRVRRQQQATTSAEAWTSVQRASRQRQEADSLAAVGAPGAAIRLLDEADMALSRAEALDPAWPEPPVLRAAVALSRARALAGDPGRMDAAIAAGIAHADRVIAADPRNAQAHELRGQLVFYRLMQHPAASERDAERMVAEAESSLVLAVRLDKQRAAAWATLSSLYYRKPNLNAAQSAAKAAYDADAYLVNARMIVARLFSTDYDLEHYNEAREWCEIGRTRFPDDLTFAQCPLYIKWMRAAESERPDSVWEIAAAYVAKVSAAERPLAEKTSRVLVAGALARAHLADSARAVLRGARADPVLDPTREVAGMEAAVRVILRDYDEAVALIEDYLSVNPGHRRGFATRTGWWWRDLQTNPRFVSLLAGAR